MIRSFQWDLARQVERLDWLVAQLPRYADWGYHEVHLHLEDAVEYPSLPGVARRDAYSYRQFGRLVDAATRAGIKVVPIVNLLGHTQYLIKVPALRDLNELRAPDGSPLERGQICPLHPRTLEIVEKLLRDMAPFCTAGKVHVGLDESFHLGKHPLSQREIAEIGLAAHFARYVGRLRELTRSFDLRMGLWADMLYFLPEAIPLLPADVIAYEWYYYTFRRRPKVELFNFKDVDLATPLRQRGIAMVGCPMNGAFRHEPLPHFRDRIDNIVSWWRHAKRTGAEGFLVTGWEPNRLALELTTAIDAAAASLWLDDDQPDPAEMLARGFARVFGKRHREAARLALAADRYPFGGYPRWQLDRGWDTISRREPLAPYRAERRFFRQLAAQARRTNAPIALRSSLEFRAYLAERDLTLRRGARGLASKAEIAALARARAVAERAVKTMWARTRDPHVVGPNQRTLAADRARLRDWRRSEPVFGGEWQLCYRVRNLAPAAQLVAVEQQAPDGSWSVRQSCHTIEFRTEAARRRGTIVREHAAPVDWDGDPARPPRLRFTLRGLGKVRIEAPALVSAKRTWAVRLPRASVGTAAPGSGWPDPVAAAQPLECHLARYPARARRSR